VPIIIDSYSQGSPEWFEAKLGNPGASSISKIITTKGEKSKQAKDYMYQLAGELISGRYEETYQSIHMERGLERELEARVLFEILNNVTVREVAVVYKDEQKKFHVSPDGLIGDNAGIEIKAPMAKTQVKYLLDEKLPTEYFSQVQMSLYVCEREYWWFFSYVPSMSPLTIRVERDEKFISSLANALDSFNAELEKTVEKLKG